MFYGNKNINQLTIILFILFIPSLMFARQISLQHSQQLLLVLTPNWQAFRGNLQRFERTASNSPWHRIGKSIPVLVGKKGMAWDAEQMLRATITKKEGDNRTPAGRYVIGPLFGFAQTNQFKMSYLHLTKNIVCVDDPKSHYYNQFLADNHLPKDWHSAEAMRAVPEYKMGAVIQYNQPDPKEGKGSCVFLHSWQSATAGTAGCIAMSADDLKVVLNWLNDHKRPIIITLPVTAFSSMEAKWQLPSLTLKGFNWIKTTY